MQRVQTNSDYLAFSRNGVNLLQQYVLGPFSTKMHFKTAAYTHVNGDMQSHTSKAEKVIKVILFIIALPLCQCATK